MSWYLQCSIKPSYITKHCLLVSWLLFDNVGSSFGLKHTPCCLWYYRSSVTSSKKKTMWFSFIVALLWAKDKWACKFFFFLIFLPWAQDGRTLRIGHKAFFWAWGWSNILGAVSLCTLSNNYWSQEKSMKYITFYFLFLNFKQNEDAV